jgi:hypothetical protein
MFKTEAGNTVSSMLAQRAGCEVEGVATLEPRLSVLCLLFATKNMTLRVLS